MPVSEIVHSVPESSPNPSARISIDITSREREEFDAILSSGSISGDKARRMIEIVRRAEQVLGPQAAERIRNLRRDRAACTLMEDQAACTLFLGMAVAESPTPNAASIISRGPC